MRPWSRILALASVTAVAAGLVGVVPAGSAAATPAPRPTSGSSRTVTLITGDVVRVGSGDKPTVAVVPRSRTGAAAAFRTVRSGRSISVLPVIAEPYLGAVLDRQLFDVTMLAAAPAGRLPVRVAYRPGATHKALPGITVTSTSGDTATGYLTPASARRFGAALAADVRAGSHRDTGLFAGVAALGYGGPVSPVVQPRFPMFTVRIRVLDQTGAAAQFASLSVVNTDDARRYVGFPFLDSGEVRISVPAGHYSVLAEIPEFRTNGSLVDRLVNLSDVTVTGATTLPIIDARTATTQVGVHTPRPATIDDQEVDWNRVDAVGDSVSSIFGFGAGDQVLVAPGKPVVHGDLHWSNAWHLTGTGGRYTYDLKWGADGAVPTQQRFAAGAANLSTLTVHYYSDVPNRPTVSFRFGILPSDFFISAIGTPVTAPSTRTEYVGGSPQVNWTQQLFGFTYSDDTTFLLGDIWVDGNRHYEPGQQATVRWERQPLHPPLDRDTGADPFFFCPACRSGDSLGVSVVPLADSDPGHIGFLDQIGPTPVGPVTASTRLRVLRGSTVLSDQRDVTGTVVSVPAGRQHYRVRYDQTRQAPWIRLGATATTEWGFDSARPTSRTAPAGWLCPTDVAACAVLPLLVPSYEVPTDGLGRVPAGRGTVVVGFAPTQGAPASPVDAAAVSWSTNGGTSWAPAPVRSLGGGRWAATVPNPAGRIVSLRVTGHDRAGSTITQTLVRAYSVR